MKTLQTLALTSVTLALAGPLAADTNLTSAQLAALITGNTLYVDIPKGGPGAPEGGIAPIYYAEDGAARALLPAGVKLVGTWALGDDQYCIDWDNGPKNSCSTLVRKADAFVVMDAKLGAPRGQVSRIATGNPENL